MSSTQHEEDKMEAKKEALAASNNVLPNTSLSSTQVLLLASIIPLQSDFYRLVESRFADKLLGFGGIEVWRC
jgi:hypothetical protein